MVKGLTAAQRAKVGRLLAEHGIDAAAPEGLERLVLALARGRKPAPPPPGPGAPYRSVIEDFLIGEMMGAEIAKLRNSGLNPSLRLAARRLAAGPFFEGMSAETIRKRHAEITRRLRDGESLPPGLQDLINRVLSLNAASARRRK